MRYTIIGAGAAGIAAAKTLRKLDPDGRIVVVSSDKDVHSRCMLHKLISGERSKADIRFIEEDFFEAYDIGWMMGVTISGIDPSEKMLRTSGGNLPYDKLLIATGADSVIPPVGALRSADNVFGLRHLSDAEAIREKALGAKRIIVIGAGLVGLDAAYALIELGKKPLVVEMEDRVLPLNLDKRGAETYRNLFESHGCVFRLGRRVADTKTVNSSISEILLDNGEVLPCDMVVVAAGVRPAIQFLEGCGVDYDRAVIVDARMRTNVPDIYAAGDVTGLSGIWPNAVEMGEIAAMNMAGRETVYDDTYAIKNTLNFFGVATLSIGALEPGEGDSVYIRESRKRYDKVILRDGVAKGVILQGDISYGGFWQHIIKNRIKIDDPVWKTSYADYFGVTQSGEYIYS